jgi:seryl-tRNA synthetase
MCDVEAVDLYGEYREQLVAAGHIIPLGVRGVVGRGGEFEHVIEQFERLITRKTRPLNPEVMRFPPVFSRAHYCGINHIHNFPDLLGSVHSFTGGQKEHRAMTAQFMAGGEWTEALTPAEVMLIPAACYPLYPTATGTMAPGGRTIDLRSFVFRHEPSDDPARLQMFRQREVVRMGTADEALAHRDAWIEAGVEILRGLGLPVEPIVANDPFFGRGGRLAKATQREQTLKYEIVVPICSEDKPTAITSSNLHLDYFGQAFGIETSDGQPAHTACVGFGLERIALALFKHHGLDSAAWPRLVRAELALDEG